MKLFFTQTYAFAYRNYIFAKRNVFVIVEMMFWPVMAVLSVGLMGGFLQLEERTLAFVLTGAIASGVLQVTQLDVGYSLLYDVWSKSIKHTFLTPAGLTPALVGPWIIGIIRGFIIFWVLYLLSLFLFEFHLPGLLSTLMFLSGVFWMSLLSGISVWVLILNYGQRAEIAVWAMAYLVMVVCGIYYPVNVLPEPLSTFGKWLPLTYFLDEFRSEYGFPHLFEHGIIKGWILNFAYTLLGIWCAKMAIRRAYRTGVLIRLSE